MSAEATTRPRRADHPSDCECVIDVRLAERRLLFALSVSQERGNLPDILVGLGRRLGSGHIIQVSSLGGITAFPAIGAYHASKWALEGFSQSLGQEVAAFGINVTLIRARRILDRLDRPVGETQSGEPGLRRRPRSAKPLVG